MNIQDALRSKKPIRRKSWVTKEFLLSELITFDENDILATDWEVEEEKPTSITIKDFEGDEALFRQAANGGFIVGINDREEVELKEEDIDKLLTFLYNNTEIGKKRVVPF